LNENNRTPSQPDRPPEMAGYAALRRSFGLLGAVGDRAVVGAARLIDAAAIGGGRLRLSRGAVAPAALVEETLAVYRPLLAWNDVRVRFFSARRVPVMWCDGERIRQVLAELLVRAGRHASGGNVTVTLEQQGGFAAITVVDDGDGAPPASLEELRLRLAGEQAPQPAGKTAGDFSLHISRYVVEAHGGSLTVLSAPGSGTAVRFTVPLRGAVRRESKAIPFRPE
jgi:signal transduction histidine kinase